MVENTQGRMSTIVKLQQKYLRTIAMIRYRTHINNVYVFFSKMIVLAKVFKQQVKWNTSV